MSTQQTTDVSADPLPSILAELAKSERFPREALERARQHREAITPRLIEAMRRGIEIVRSGQPLEDDITFYGLYLLGEFKAKEALPTIVDALSLPETGLDELFGDALTEVMSRVLAALADDQLDLIDGLIDDPALYEFVREAASQSYLYLVKAGRLDRDVAVDRQRMHLRAAMARRDLWSVTWAINALVDLSTHEALPEIEQAFEQGLVEESIISLNFTRECIETPWQEQLKRLFPSEIDVVQELERWDHADRSAATLTDAPSHAWSPAQDWLDGEDLDGAWQEPVRGVARIGRNESCPCGSGKKYKKCCGAPGQRAE